MLFISSSIISSYSISNIFSSIILFSIIFSKYKSFFASDKGLNVVGKGIFTSSTIPEPINSSNLNVSSIVNLVLDNILIGLGGVSFNSVIPVIFLNKTKSPVSSFKYFFFFLPFLTTDTGSISTTPGQALDIDLIK